MKKLICLLLCLMLTPAFAVAERAFPNYASEIQWHLSDMLERYLIWEDMGMADGKKEVFGYAADGEYPDFVMRTDSSDRLYELRVSALVDTVYDSYAAEDMTAVIESAAVAAETIALLGHSQSAQSASEYFRNAGVWNLLQDIQRTRSLSRYINSPFQQTFSFPGFSCTQELRYIQNRDCFFYEITLTPGW